MGSIVVLHRDKLRRLKAEKASPEKLVEFENEQTNFFVA
jgi:hypothetical protein